MRTGLGTMMGTLARRITKTAATIGTAATLALGATPAMATSSSGSAYFDNGQRITANMWIQSFSWTGCGSFQSSAVMAVSPNYITNRTSFYQYGLGSLSIKGLSIESSRSGSNSIVWTNSNGARGSYLSGSVCGGWGAVYVGADVSASAYYYGNYRVASAHI